MSVFCERCLLVFLLAAAWACAGEPAVEQTDAHTTHVGPVTDDDAGLQPGDAARDADGVLVSAVLDADTADARVQDTDAWRRPEVSFPEPGSRAPLKLSELGLYRDSATKQLAPDLIEYEPRYALWADGALKRRWLYLPAGTGIDTSDPDHYRFPQGSVLFKEFASEAGKRLETRVLARTGPLPSDVFMGSFVWLDDESDALFQPDGASNVRGTQHDVPTQKNCDTCHRGEPGRVLGFAAVQQPRVLGSSFVVPGARYDIPGDEAARAALGYLHANCAHCHNEDGIARKDTRLALRISVHDVTPASTAIERSVVGVLTDHFTDHGEPAGLRVKPGDPEGSAVVKRMKLRGVEGTAMPPLGTERVDELGLRSIERWITSLSGG